MLSWLYEEVLGPFAVTAKKSTAVVKEIREDDGFGHITPQVWMSGTQRIPWFWSPGQRFPYHFYVAGIGKGEIHQARLDMDNPLRPRVIKYAGYASKTWGQRLGLKYSNRGQHLRVKRKGKRSSPFITNR